MSESFPEKTRTILATPFRYLGGIAMDRLHIAHGNRYDRHRSELLQSLRTIHTHHSEHHLLRRFISDIPKSFSQSSDENDTVRVLDTFPVRANGHSDHIQLITAALLGEDNVLDGKTIVKMAYEVDQTNTDEAGSIYRDVAKYSKPLSRVERNDSEESLISEVRELVVPTLIPNVVIGFSGLGISRLNDMEGSPLDISFYSVPEQ